MSGLVDEVNRFAPEFFSLLLGLGQNEYSIADSDECKVVTSLMCLVKCRSSRVLGLQLLMAYMLLARSTSRQVCSVTCSNLQRII